MIYQDGETKLEAYLAWDSAMLEPRPAVLIFHGWGGRDEFVCQKAEALAELGYVGCALDIYGKGILGKNTDENAKLMQPFIDDRALLRKRILAGRGLGGGMGAGCTVPVRLPEGAAEAERAAARLQTGGCDPQADGGVLHPR